LNEKRSYKRRAELFDQSDPSQPTPDEESDKQRMARAVWESIENLPGNQRVAILLAKYEEMPLADIGRVLGATEGAVKQLLHRAKVELREKLAQFL
jgi:RNA polymerase sigma-70 factor (ECF subfamily)